MTRSRWALRSPPYAPWRDRPLATVAAQAGAVRIAAANTAAQNAGIDPGLSLPDARAVVPTLKVIDADPGADKTCLGRLLVWVRRYTPWVSLEPLDERGGASLWLDITGCAHLFGGEQATLDDFAIRLERLGFASRLGLADTPGAAWAAAHCVARETVPAIVPEGKQRTHLAGVPVSALRLSLRPLDTLTRLGVRTLTDLFALPRAPLTRRFGQEVCLRLDQFTGRVDEPLSPDIERLPYVAHMAFPEPIGRTEDVEAALRALLESLCQRLEKDRKGARRMTFELFCVDNTSERLQVGTGQPVRRPEHLFRLFREKLDGVDAGFGIEFFLLTVTATDPLDVEQEAVFQDTTDHVAAPVSAGRELALLIDRLEGRLGTGRVVRPRVRAVHIPERAAGLVPALNANKDHTVVLQDREAGLLHSDRIRIRPGTRPVYLLPKPEPINPLPIQLDTPRIKTVPLPGFQWRRSTYRLTAAEGPERIAGRWWQGLLPLDRSDDGAPYFALCEDGGAVRDYWRVESEAGERLWVFHLPFPLVRGGAQQGALRGARSDPNSLDRWFVHGLFA